MHPLEKLGRDLLAWIELAKTDCRDYRRDVWRELPPEVRDMVRDAERTLYAKGP